MVRCWAFTQAYNERDLIAYWVRHYVTFCERVIVYVDQTTDDGTDRIAREEGAEVRAFFNGGRLDDAGFVRFAQERYPEARCQADYAVWADADEIIYHPRLTERLAELRGEGVTLPRVAGYQMVADAPPSGNGQIYREITKGLPAAEYNKPCVFDPKLDLTWTPGKHDAAVAGNGATRDDGCDPLKLLHYRYLGEAWHAARNARNFARIDEANRAARHGREVYPDWQGVYSPQWFREHAHEAVDVVTA